MRYKYFFLVLLVLFSCKKEEGGDCGTQQTYFHFNLIDKKTDRNLAFGPAAVYKPEEMGLFALTANGAKLYFEYRVINSVPVPHLLTSLDGTLTPNGTNNMYLQLSDGDIDTLTFQFPVVNRVKGCNDYRLIDLKYNSTLVCTDCQSGTVFNFYK